MPVFDISKGRDVRPEDNRPRTLAEQMGVGVGVAKAKLLAARNEPRPPASTDTAGQVDLATLLAKVESIARRVAAFEARRKPAPVRATRGVTRIYGIRGLLSENAQ